jgi:hypothetical protein
VVVEEAYSKGSPDYRSTLVKLKGHGPRDRGALPDWPAQLASGKAIWPFPGWK